MPQNKLVESLQETDALDYSNDAVQAFLQKHLNRDDGQSPKEQVLSIYYAVREHLRYNPYRLEFTPEALKASVIVNRTDGHCIDKAILMIACCRAIGVPARLGLAKVRNHIGTARLEKEMNTNILVPHGYVAVYLDNRWIKATPAFNKGLCDKLGVTPLDFDGETDSLFQEYNDKGGQFMEYLEDYNTFEDVPLDFMLQKMQEAYPSLFAKHFKHKKIVL